MVATMATAQADARPKPVKRPPRTNSRGIATEQHAKNVLNARTLNGKRLLFPDVVSQWCMRSPKAGSKIRSRTCLGRRRPRARQRSAPALAGWAKFGSPDVWITMFEGWGYPAWFSFVIGASELGLGIVLLVPRFASYAAIGLIVIMFGALEAVLTTETALGWFDPVLHLVFLTIIGTVHWKRRWRWRQTGEVAQEAASGP